jgi:hypothetical protein
MIVVRSESATLLSRVHAAVPVEASVRIAYCLPFEPGPPPFLRRWAFRLSASAHLIDTTALPFASHSRQRIRRLRSSTQRVGR